MMSLEILVERLSAASERAAVPDALAWPDDVDGLWCFSPEWSCLAGSRWHSALPEPERRRLSLVEARSFFSINVHGERILSEGIRARLASASHRELHPYLRHFVDEEDRHSAMFTAFCDRFAGGVLPDRSVAFPREMDAEDADVLFFARVLAFEEIVDVYNVAMARDERLAPIVRAIHGLHHADESRHLAFGRRLVGELFARAATRWTAEQATAMREEVAAHVHATWRAVWSIDVLRAAGCRDALAAREAAWCQPAARAHRERISRRALRSLVHAGALPATWRSP
jgi:ribosomal protein S18 acetylase RimI-like enzyme